MSDGPGFDPETEPLADAFEAAERLDEETLGAWTPTSHRAVIATPDAVVLVERRDGRERVPYRAVTDVAVETSHSTAARVAAAAGVLVAVVGLGARGLGLVPPAVGLLAAGLALALVAGGWSLGRRHRPLTTVTVTTVGPGRGHTITFDDEASAEGFAAHLRAFGLERSVGESPDGEDPGAAG